METDLKLDFLKNCYYLFKPNAKDLELNGSYLKNYFSGAYSLCDENLPNILQEYVKQYQIKPYKTSICLGFFEDFVGRNQVFETYVDDFISSCLLTYVSKSEKEENFMERETLVERLNREAKSEIPKQLNINLINFKFLWEKIPRITENNDYYPFITTMVFALYNYVPYLIPQEDPRFNDDDIIKIIFRLQYVERLNLSCGLPILVIPENILLHFLILYLYEDQPFVGVIECCEFFLHVHTFLYDLPDNMILLDFGYSLINIYTELTSKLKFTLIEPYSEDDEVGEGFISLIRSYDHILTLQKELNLYKIKPFISDLNSGPNYAQNDVWSTLIISFSDLCVKNACDILRDKDYIQIKTLETKNANFNKELRKLRTKNKALFQQALKQWGDVLDNTPIEHWEKQPIDRIINRFF